MTHERFDRRLSPQDHAALFDAAKRRAAELRSAAMREFWRGVAQRIHGVGAAITALPRLLAGAPPGRPWRS
jgi:DNA-binding GntR family transcriptional regulator